MKEESLCVVAKFFEVSVRRFERKILSEDCICVSWGFYSNLTIVYYHFVCCGYFAVFISRCEGFYSGLRLLGGGG